MLPGSLGKFISMKVLACRTARLRRGLLMGSSVPSCRAADIRRANRFFMTPNTAASSRLPSTYDEFLFARIGDDADGSSVSVLSAFARLDQDPWIEAGRLARMSKDVAVASLAKTMGLPINVADGNKAAVTTASRLIALLTPLPIGSTHPKLAMDKKPKFSERLLISCFVLSWLCFSIFVAQQYLTRAQVSALSDAKAASEVKTPSAGRQ